MNWTQQSVTAGEITLLGKKLPTYKDKPQESRFYEFLMDGDKEKSRKKVMANPFKGRILFPVEQQVVAITRFFANLYTQEGSSQTGVLVKRLEEISLATKIQKTIAEGRMGILKTDNENKIHLKVTESVAKLFQDLSVQNIFIKKGDNYILVDWRLVIHTFAVKEGLSEYQELSKKHIGNWLKERYGKQIEEQERCENKNLSKKKWWPF